MKIRGHHAALGGTDTQLPRVARLYPFGSQRVPQRD
jgi:hypothetical protein